MGGIIACVCCYCCLMALKPRCIEILALVCNVIEIGFLIWGIADIPWSDISGAGKGLFFAACVFVVLSLIFLLALMILRCNNSINTTKNSVGKCVCITDLVFDILAEILLIIAEIIIFRNMNDKDDNYYFDYGYRTSRRNSIYSDRQWACAIISITGAEVFLGLHCYCVSFLLKLISLKTDLSYNNYMETIDNNNNIFGRTVNIFNSPENNNPNQLNFLGYDKDGHPIYSGNAQYFSQTQPNALNLTDTNVSSPNDVKVVNIIEPK